MTLVKFDLPADRMARLPEDVRKRVEQNNAAFDAAEQAKATKDLVMKQMQDALDRITSLEAKLEGERRVLADEIVRRQFRLRDLKLEQEKVRAERRSIVADARSKGFKVR